MNLSFANATIARIRGTTLAALAALSICSMPLCAQDAKPAGNSVRPEVGKPLQAAVDLLRAKKYRDAMAKIHETEAALMLGGKSAYEVYMVQRVKGQIAASGGEPVVAAEAFETAIASGAAPG